MKLFLRALAILVLGLAFFLVPAFANDLPTISEPYIIWADITKDGLLFNADYANITLINPEFSTIVNSDGMINYATGIYYYNYTFEEMGEWLGIVDFYFNDSKIATVSQSILVQNEGLKMIAENLIFLLVILVTAIIGFSTKNNVIFMFSGILFMIAPLAYDYTFNVIPSGLAVITFVLVGLAVIYQAIDYMAKEKKAKR